MDFDNNNQQSSGVGQSPPVNPAPDPNQATPPPAPNYTVPTTQMQVGPKKSSKKLLIIILVLVLLLGASAAAYFLMSGDDKKDTQSQTNDNKDEEPAANDDDSQGPSQTELKERDIQRVTDINLMHAKLEEYFNENAAYPKTFTAATFPGIDAQALVDPDERAIKIAEPAADEATAIAAKVTEGSDYLYVPYDCQTDGCTGYVLKTFIEVPSTTTPNPFTKLGLNNS